MTTTNTSASGLPDWAYADDLGGLVPSEIRQSICTYGDQRAAEEREACAKLCDEIERNKWTPDAFGQRMPGPARCAAAIRARKD